MEKQWIKWEIFDFLKDLVWIVVIVVIIRSFIAEPFQISGQSMADSYYDKEFIIVDRFSYLNIPKIKKWELKRGDVVVFKPWVNKDKKYFIKRIIWVPGDTVRIKDWDVFLKNDSTYNFIKLDEPYLNLSNSWNTKVWNLKVEYNYRVPEWKYFLMWDNRAHSSDSRTCFSFSCEATKRDSFISKDEIVGRMFLDLGYFNFYNFSFTHPKKWLSTEPKWFSTPSSYDYWI